jgi:hypothetical protein
VVITVGAGSAGVANIRCVLEQFKGRVEDWGYGELHAESEGRESQLVRVLGDSGYPQDYRHEWQHRLPDPEAVCLHVEGAYSSESIYLLEGDGDCNEILAALEDYRCLDNEAVSEVEMEWEDEAWKSWLRSDLISTLSDELGEDEPEDALTLREWADEQEDHVLWDAYRAAMEATNTDPVPEYAGVHVDVDRIAYMFEEYLHQLRIDEPRLELEAAGQLPLPLEVLE